jgi:hypothetical protein
MVQKRMSFKINGNTSLWSASVIRLVCIVVKSTLQIRLAHPHVCIHPRSSNWTDCREIWYLGILWKICLESPNFVKIGQKYRALYMTIWVGFIAARDINSTIKHFCAAHRIFILLAVACSSGMQTMHLCLSVATVVTRTRRIIPLYVHCLYRVKYFSTCTVFNATKAKIISWLCYGVSLLAVNLQLTCNMKWRLAYVCFFCSLFKKKLVMDLMI